MKNKDANFFIQKTFFIITKIIESHYMWFDSINQLAQPITFFCKKIIENPNGLQNFIIFILLK
jgi:hypothetical protein